MDRGPRSGISGAALVPEKPDAIADELVRRAELIALPPTKAEVRNEQRRPALS